MFKRDNEAESPGQAGERADLSWGTAAPTIGGLSGDVGAKTGTAEMDGRTKPNSWFVAYRDDVAAAAVVPGSGEGYKFAGKIVTALLGAS
jgi:cell division protein FtsI/penicillin-binding protein 2